MFNSWDGDLAPDKFVSVVVLSYTRPKRLKECLQSIHEHADMPVEIIVHDDASGRELEVEIFNECRHLCSSLIFSSPERLNMGLASAANRAVSLANSEYILLLNDDCKLTGGEPLLTIKKVLDVPYVGCFGPWQTAKGLKPGAAPPGRANIPVSANGVDFHISSLPNGAGIFAFKKSTWIKTGGFPQVYTNAGDTGFHIKLLKMGYFNASRLINVEEMFTNVDQEAGYKEPTAGRAPVGIVQGQLWHLDSSYPHIFLPDVADPTGALFELSMERRYRVYQWSHHEYYTDEGLVNHAWWDRLFQEICKDPGQGIDWEILKPYGQEKWREQVEADMAAWRAKAG